MYVYTYVYIHTYIWAWPDFGLVHIADAFTVLFLKYLNIYFLLKYGRIYLNFIADIKTWEIGLPLLSK